MGAQKSKLMDESQITRLSFLEDGGFAKVYKGYLNGQPVSIKVPRVNEKIRKDRKLVKTHIEEVKKLLPNISKPKGEDLVRVFGVAYDNFRKEVWVIREFVDGSDLETLLKNPSLCPKLRCPEQRVFLAQGIARGIEYLHNRRGHSIVHGDFKPSDVLIEASTLKPRITNFGLWDFKKFFIENTLPDYVVFLNPFQAPEVLIGGERPCLFSDIWSVGAVILECIMDKPPWDLKELCSRYRRHSKHREVQAMREAMNRKEDPTVIKYIDDVQDDYPLDFLRDCLSYVETDRPSAKELKQNMDILAQSPTWTNIAYHKYYA